MVVSKKPNKFIETDMSFITTFSKPKKKPLPRPKLKLKPKDLKK